VLRLVDRRLPKGAQKLELDAHMLATGSYYCHVQEGSRTSSRLVAVLK
jgi:hypothetical protein